MFRRRHNYNVTMNAKTDILNILQDYIEAPVEEIATDMPFKAVASIDSFMLIELIATIEDHFGVTISNTDLGGFNTIDDIVAYVESKNMA